MKKKKIFGVVFIAVLWTQSVTAQVHIHHGVKISGGDLKHMGMVVDAQTNKPLEGAVISNIFSVGDQVAVQNCVTDKDGKFSYMSDKVERRIEIACEGYKLFVKMLPPEGKEVDLGTIKLLPDTDHADEMIVKLRVTMNKLDEHRGTFFFLPFKKEMTLKEIVKELQLVAKVKFVEKDNSFFFEEIKLEPKDISARLLFGEEPQASLKK